MSSSATQRTIDAVWRIESAKIIAGLARMLRDVGLAEELAQDALVAALEQWPEAGVPDNPAAWLTTVAKHRALDHLRRQKVLEIKHEEFGREEEVRQELADAEATTAIDAKLDDGVGDDLLRLIFVACHPLLSPEGRTALTLRMIGGLTTDEIARAFLVPEATIAQRIVRAKRTLADAKVPFEVPRGDERKLRLASVLEVLYLVFNEGYAATTGDHWMRPQLCEEALRLARILVALVPGEAEAHGLVALMELQASRLRSRADASGAPILLLDQDRSRWDQMLIRRGLAELQRAASIAADSGTLHSGPYGVQAAIAACHARARIASATDWHQIASLYQVLNGISPSPVIELNRAVAVSMASGPAAGLALVDALRDEPMLRDYHLLPSVRGDLLAKLGRSAEARDEFLKAAALTRNAREHTLLLARAGPGADHRS